ncbi:MAG: hypothetical protein AAGD38_24885 [Acidobacteriota bacterium]
MWLALVFAVFLGFGTIAGAETSDEPERLHAPYPLAEPTASVSPADLYLLFQMPGDYAQVRYSAGSLDRSANLQARLELLMHTLDRWLDVETKLNVVVISREVWDRSEIPIRYGLPVRAGANTILVPAHGDADTVNLWSWLLDGALPAIQGLPILGSPRELASMVLADVLVQHFACEIALEQARVVGQPEWLDELLPHLVSIGFSQRFEERRLTDLASLWARLGSRHAQGSIGVDEVGRRDFDLLQWLHVQGQLHEGARQVLAEEETGRDTVRRVRRLAKKGDGVITEAAAHDRWEELQPWLSTSFPRLPIRAK